MWLCSWLLVSYIFYAASVIWLHFDFWFSLREESFAIDSPCSLHHLLWNCRNLLFWILNSCLLFLLNVFLLADLSDQNASLAFHRNVWTSAKINIWSLFTVVLLLCWQILKEKCWQISASGRSFSIVKYEMFYLNEFPTNPMT